MPDVEAPIFESVMAEQKITQMPLPPFPTHEEFLAERGHAEWLEFTEEFLAPAEGCEGVEGAVND